MILKLCYYGNPILREIAEPVDVIDEGTGTFVDDLFDTLFSTGNGIGLAAPQVGRSIQVFVTCVPQEGPDNRWIQGRKLHFINPKILHFGEEKALWPEACLSIPGVSGDVERSTEVRVEFSTVDGERKTETFYGYEADCIMHEYDHIRGVLFIDRLPKWERKEIDPVLKQIKKKYRS